IAVLPDRRTRGCVLPSSLAVLLRKSSTCDAAHRGFPSLRCTSQNRISKPHCRTLTLVKRPYLCSRRVAGSCNADGLNVHELFDAIVGELAPVSALLDATKGKPRIRAYMLVDKYHPAVDELGGNVLAASEITRENP